MKTSHIVYTSSGFVRSAGEVFPPAGVRGIPIELRPV